MAFGAVLRLTEEKAAVAIADGVFCDKGKSKKIEEYSVKAFKDYEALEKARIEAGFSMNGLCASEENKVLFHLLQKTKKIIFFEKYLLFYK